MGTELTMTREQKIIRGKVGVLELAKQLGSVSQACKIMGYSRDSWIPPETLRLRRMRVV
jgi:molybdenum-dependent DNA-binding transcriptional regulator ModE